MRVHGGADLLGDEHEGPRAVLRQRVPRARDRGAAARRERVAGRLRRRRAARSASASTPSRASARSRAARSSRRARRAARSSRSGTSPSASTRRSSNKRALESLVKCGALPGLAARGCSRCSSRRSPTARSSRPTGSPARARSSTSAPPRTTSREAPSADPDRRVREDRAAAAGEGGARPLRLRASALGDPRPAARARPTRRSPSSSGAATARSSSSAASSARVKQMTTKRGEPMVFLRLDDVTGGVESSSSTRPTRRARALRRRPHPDRQGPRRPQGGRDEARRARGDRVRGGRRDKREVRLRIDATEAPRRHDPRARAADPRLPGRGARSTSTCVTSQGTKMLRVRPEYRVKPGAGLLRRGAGAPRRVRARLSQLATRSAAPNGRQRPRRDADHCAELRCPR